MEELHGEELDLALHDCMAMIWKAYRESLAKGDFDIYQDSFEALRAKYKDEAVNAYITGMGTGLIKSLSRRAREGESNDKQREI